MRMKILNEASPAEVDRALKQSKSAFGLYSKLSLQERANFLTAIAAQLEAAREELVAIAFQETNLEPSRLAIELQRAIFQLNSYGAACAKGNWLDIRIDTQSRESIPFKNDLRKMLIPLGPVVVFGASNFPFAYSTAGGDMACALAAGCTVIIKAHPAHGQTSEVVACAVQKALKDCHLPDGVFIHLHGKNFEVGELLVSHALTSAIGFTGSLEGGKALFDLANRRAKPIPVFAEMGSLNPVFMLPGLLKKDPSALAKTYAASITLGAGQFCTNPGIMVALQDENLEAFSTHLAQEIKQIKPALMLHPGIAINFKQKMASSLKQKGVQVLAASQYSAAENESLPTIASVEAAQFLANPLLHQEVFGPFSLLVRCKTNEEMLSVARGMEGQLTASVMGLEEELQSQNELVESLQQICGRLIFNGVPTGVQVSLAMHHGGPFPATTDSRFTAVGADGIKRFARPICFQGWPNNLLPLALQDENPLKIWRTINNELTQQAVVRH
ncbi:MAG: aldehyde dehydrogenase (NADP(+)) [Flavisolibacter sp.]